MMKNTPEKENITLNATMMMRKIIIVVKIQI